MEKKRKRREEERALVNNDTIITTTTTTTNSFCLEWRSSRLEKEEESSKHETCENRETVERYSRQMRLPLFQHDKNAKGGQSRLVKATCSLQALEG